MNSDRVAPAVPEKPAVKPGRALGELFLISVLILFLELACIRWFPAHVLFLTFFTNTVLLACFLGMSLGCLAASHPRNYLAWTPALLVLALVAAQASSLRTGWRHVLDVGHQASPQFVFFGTEDASSSDVAQLRHSDGSPGRLLFPGDRPGLGRAGPGPGPGPGQVAQPRCKPTLSISSAASSASSCSPVLAGCNCALWWFLPVVLGLAISWYQRPLPAAWSSAGPARPGRAGGRLAHQDRLQRSGRTDARIRLVAVLPHRLRHRAARVRLINVNLIGHQQMVSAQTTVPASAYALPHLLNRDAQRLAGQAKPFNDVLVIGAGSGNDVSRALQWGAEHVDAVEIDPVIQGLGKRDHPDQPYARSARHRPPGRRPQFPALHRPASTT